MVSGLRKVLLGLHLVPNSGGLGVADLLGLRGLDAIPDRIRSIGN